jgi:hypothetical protein
VNRAPIRIESQQSLRLREAVVELIEGIARAKDVPLDQNLDTGITEATLDELAECVSEVVELRLTPRDALSPLSAE